ncbi:MAG: AAC(3) family N-acetyltransferase, partial [Planctomycetota bacterium]
YDPADLEELDLSAEARERVRAQVPGYDPARSNVAQNGAVPEAFRGWPGVVRSPHPTSSVLLWGGDAGSIAAPHDYSGWARTTKST